MHLRGNNNLLSKFFLLTFLISFFSCTNNAGPATANATFRTEVSSDDENPYSRISEIPLPAGFRRIKAPENSFADWLRKLDLKKDKKVYKYDGSLKTNQSAQFAVLDITTGKTDLQQCADAVMRLRTEYLYARQRFGEISFRDNAGVNYLFNAPYTRAELSKYLNKVFAMCGTASLAKQLKSVPKLADMQTGDVLIRGGFPGHAVMVIDMAENTSGKKIYLLAQSYMPAQDIHVKIFSFSLTSYQGESPSFIGLISTWISCAGI